MIARSGTSPGTSMRTGSISVAYQGLPGANGERAITAHWQGAAHPVPLRSFTAVAAAVADGAVDFGVIPTWNSTIGVVRSACEALEGAYACVEEVEHVTVPVRHALLALPGTQIDAVRAVGSHPAALGQCRRFLSAHSALVAVPAWDTAGAATELAALAEASTGVHSIAGAAVPESDAPWHAIVPDAAADQLAVIADAGVAALLGLSVLATDIQDDPDNRTRFAIVRARSAAWRW